MIVIRVGGGGEGEQLPSKSFEKSWRIHSTSKLGQSLVRVSKLGQSVLKLVKRREIRTCEFGNTMIRSEQ